MSTDADRPVAFVLSASADIGRGLTERLLADGWRVVGTGRNADRLDSVLRNPAFKFVPCDLTDKASIAAAVDAFAAERSSWDLFVSSAGTMEPIGPFFELDFDSWESSVQVNSTAQLRVLHGLWPYRRRGSVDVMLMAGGGTNNAFTNYSAYCAAKILLIKMCELLDDEEGDLNIFIIGPGYVRTRIHQETLRAGSLAGSGLEKTLRFLEQPGTPMDDIYANLRWCMGQGRRVTGGRNFSTVHDPWRDGGTALAQALRNDPDCFRLRRSPYRKIE